jgi:hypothetical protein
MKIKNWKKSVLNRDSWKTIVEWTKTHIELQHLSRTRVPECATASQRIWLLMLQEDIMVPSSALESKIVFCTVKM